MSIMLFDPIYSGHHISYAKGLKLNTQNTILIINKNKQEHFNDIFNKGKIILNCNDPQSFKIPLIGWLVNIFFLLLNRQIRNNSIHFLYADSIIHYIFLFQLISRSPIYLTIHWCSSIVSLDKRDRSCLKRISRSIKENMFILIGKRAKVIFCNGKFSKRAIEELYTSIKIVDIPYGIEQIVDREEILESNQKLNRIPTVLFFGGIRTDKGIEQLAELVKLCPKINFIIAGKPLGYSNYQVKRLFENRKNVHLNIGFIPDEDIQQLFLKADILILPYNKHFAGQSGPLTIATVYRVPVIATKVGDMGEDIEDFGLGITSPSNEPILLAERLEKLLNTDKEKIKNAHDEYYQRGLWKNVGKQIESYYLGF